MKKVNVVTYFSELPDDVSNGDMFYVEESKQWFDQIAYYTYDKGAWKITYEK